MTAGAVQYHRLLSDDAVFAPNQQVLLSELETEEREIESFKRFDYYFKPPANKLKVNFDIKDIVVAQRKAIAQSSSSASLFYDDLAAADRFNNVSSTPMMDDFFADMSLLSLRPTSAFSSADLGILASNGGASARGIRRGDNGFVNGLLDGGEMKSGLVD